MTTINLKELAYTTLSDSREFGKKMVNIYRVASHLGFTYDTVRDSDYLGKIHRDYDGYELGVSEKLSSAERNFETATLLAFALLQPNLPKVLPVGFAIQHAKDGNDIGMRMATHLAGILMAYSFTPKELSYVDHPKGELKLAKLAQKKGIPTRVLLRRMAEVIDGTNIDFDNSISMVNVNDSKKKKG